MGNYDYTIMQDGIVHICEVTIRQYQNKKSHENQDTFSG